jgi:hypothetical protein
LIAVAAFNSQHSLGYALRSRLRKLGKFGTGALIAAGCALAGHVVNSQEWK